LKEAKESSSVDLTNLKDDTPKLKLTNSTPEKSPKKTPEKRTPEKKTSKKPATSVNLIFHNYAPPTQHFASTTTVNLTPSLETQPPSDNDFKMKLPIASSQGSSHSEMPPQSEIKVTEVINIDDDEIL